MTKYTKVRPNEKSIPHLKTVRDGPESGDLVHGRSRPVLRNQSYYIFGHYLSNGQKIRHYRNNYDLIIILKNNLNLSPYSKSPYPTSHLSKPNNPNNRS